MEQDKFENEILELVKSIERIEKAAESFYGLIIAKEMFDKKCSGCDNYVICSKILDEELMIKGENIIRDINILSNEEMSNIEPEPEKPDEKSKSVRIKVT